MERISGKKEEGVAERTTTLYHHHPCYFLEEAFRALLKCLGIETTPTKNDEQKSSNLKSPSDADLDPVIATPKASATSIIKKSNQEAADPPSTSTQNIDNASLVARRGRPSLSQGSGPRHN